MIEETRAYIALEEIKDVWQDWKADRHRWRSSTAMVKISTILTEAEAVGR